MFRPAALNLMSAYQAVCRGTQDLKTTQYDDLDGYAIAKRLKIAGLEYTRKL
jgi:hypothetical protein